ncbi:MAG TPA: sigma-70 family RNA polymerase sigma factor [Chryseosolibacter sp.]|nr:sigma-70 family RNA polymerase sigma factor [Chryseosolibacter sp.]
MKPEISTEKQLVLEEEIIEKAKNNPQAFRAIYERYYKPIFLFVLHRIGQKEQSADITSQVFLKALVNINAFTFRGLPFSSWLYRIAVNECNSYFRKNKRARLVVLEDFHVANLYEEMFGENFQEEMKARLPVILEKLKPDELQVVELRYLEGRPFREVAEILNITETYAKVRTYRILEKMKKLFVGK